MSSNALNHWESTRLVELQEIQDAHIQVEGSNRGRRFATQQINYAVAVLLSSQFQGFCRDLHTEAVDLFVERVQPASLRGIVRTRMTEGRKLDRGNPNPGNVGADFQRFGFDFWSAVYEQDARNRRRREYLQELADWRNAISHQDFSRLGDRSLQLTKVRDQWLPACRQLARQFDVALGAHFESLFDETAWW